MKKILTIIASIGIMIPCSSSVLVSCSSGSKIDLSKFDSGIGIIGEPKTSKNKLNNLAATYLNIGSLIKAVEFKLQITNADLSAPPVVKAGKSVDEAVHSDPASLTKPIQDDEVYLMWMVAKAGSSRVVNSMSSQVIYASKDKFELSNIKDLRFHSPLGATAAKSGLNATKEVVNKIHELSGIKSSISIDSDFKTDTSIFEGQNKFSAEYYASKAELTTTDNSKYFTGSISKGNLWSSYSYSTSLFNNLQDIAIDSSEWSSDKLTQAGVDDFYKNAVSQLIKQVQSRAMSGIIISGADIIKTFGIDKDTANAAGIKTLPSVGLSDLTYNSKYFTGPPRGDLTVNITKS